MKQEEKNKISKEKILNAAIVEFGTKNYIISSLNNICNDNKISKGLIYHYYKNKDDLFLSCIKYCFDSLVNYIRRESLVEEDFQNSMQKYLNLRYKFFNENIYFRNIFFNAIIQPPMHLKDDIKLLRKEFDEINLEIYKLVLSNITLREGITENDAIEYFGLFQDMFNGYFERKLHDDDDFNGLIKVHEEKLEKMMNIILYGIAERGGY